MTLPNGNRAKHYRARATEVRAIAAATDDEAAKAALNAVASDYDMMAAEMESRKYLAS